MAVLCFFSLTGTQFSNIFDLKFVLERVNILQLKTDNKHPNRIDLALSRLENYGGTILR